jgi:asparagine synthase (glutamine-hydrolysing)
MNMPAQDRPTSVHSTFAVRWPVDGQVSGGTPRHLRSGPFAWEAGDDHLHVTGVGRLAEIGACPQRGTDAASAALSACRRHGLNVADKLDGTYALAAYDSQRNVGVVAVDRFGTSPIYYATHGGWFAAASTPRAVCDILGIGRLISNEAILAYCYFHAVPAPLSIYAGVARLDIGEFLRLQKGRTEVGRWWNPEFDERRDFDFRVERSRFFEALRDGISESTRDVDPEHVGAFLSGGTDSSSIAGLLCEVLKRPARTFSIGFDVADYDERKYSRLAVERFGTDHTEHAVTPLEAEAAIDAVISAHEQPFGNSSAVPTYICARIAAERGIQIMLGGDGGDELFGGNERYAKQRVFAKYEYVPKQVRAALIDPLVRRLHPTRPALLRKAFSYVQQAGVPLPARLQTYNLLNRVGWTEIFNPDYLAAVDPSLPVRIEQTEWQRSEGADQLNRLLAYDFKFTLGDNDLPKVARMCEHAGVESAFPMLTRRVVDMSLRLPASQKLRGTELRYFFRKSLRGFLPDEIIDKSKHGFGMPFGTWMLQQRTLSLRALAAMEGLARRGIIRSDFTDRLAHAIRSEHAGFYGTLAWVLMVLEEWLVESERAHEIMIPPSMRSMPEGR